MIEKLKITFWGDTLGCAAQFEPNGEGLAIGQWGKDAEGKTTLTLTRAPSPPAEVVDDDIEFLIKWAAMCGSTSQAIRLEGIITRLKAAGVSGVPEGESYRHRNDGWSCRILGRGHIEGAIHVTPHDELVIYKKENGDVLIGFSSTFDDRFEPAAAPER